MDEQGFRRLVAGQFGVFTGAQAARFGVDHNRLRRMLSAGEVARMLPGVYRLQGSPASYMQSVISVCLWAGPGGVMSHRTSGALLDLCDRDNRVIEVTTGRNLRPPSARIVVYRRAPLPPIDVSRVSGVPVTTMPRTVIDMASVCSEESVDVALDAAIRLGMRRELFLARLEGLSAKGRNGTGLLRRLVAERVTEQGLAESPFERRLLRALRRARLPRPVCQFVISEGDFRARVDFAYPDQRLIVEADSYRWHAGRAAWERDRLRMGELAARGMRVLPVTWLQLKYHETEAVARIGRALGIMEALEK